MCDSLTLSSPWPPLQPGLGHGLQLLQQPKGVTLSFTNLQLESPFHGGHPRFSHSHGCQLPSLPHRLVSSLGRMAPSQPLAPRYPQPHQCSGTTIYFSAVQQFGDLTCLSVSGPLCVITDSHVVLQLDRGLKQDCTGHTSPPIHLFRAPNEIFCPVSHLRAYTQESLPFPKHYLSQPLPLMDQPPVQL